MTSPAVDAAARMRVDDYDPGLVISAVNALLPLGKDAALGQVEAVKPDPPASGLFWVLRVLFEVPDPPGFPPVILGTPVVPPPRDLARLPRYPIVIIRDVPLFVAGGYVLRGFPEPIDTHVAFYREHGTLRSQPLSPSGSRQEIEAELLEVLTNAYEREHRERSLAAVSAQLARFN
jgi:hypothetical protein